MGDVVGVSSIGADHRALGLDVCGVLSKTASALSHAQVGIIVRIFVGIAVGGGQHASMFRIFSPGLIRTHRHTCSASSQDSIVPS